MIVDFDQPVIADDQQAVAPEILQKIFADFVFVQVVSLNQQLCVISVFQHLLFSFAVPTVFLVL